DRYKSSINGRVVVSGSGTTPKEMDVTAKGTLTDTTILGGRLPQLSFDAAVAGDTARVKATGAFSEIDPAVVGGKPEMKGTVAGTLDVDATVNGFSEGLTPENVEAGGRIDLQASTIGGLKIDRASIDAD